MVFRLRNWNELKISVLMNIQSHTHIGCETAIHILIHEISFFGSELHWACENQIEDSIFIFCPITNCRRESFNARPFADENLKVKTLYHWLSDVSSNRVAQPIDEDKKRQSLRISIANLYNGFEQANLFVCYHHSLLLITCLLFLSCLYISQLLKLKSMPQLHASSVQYLCFPNETLNYYFQCWFWFYFKRNCVYSFVQKYLFKEKMINRVKESQNWLKSKTMTRQ